MKFLEFLGVGKARLKKAVAISYLVVLGLTLLGLVINGAIQHPDHALDALKIFGFVFGIVFLYVSLVWSIDKVVE